MMTSGRMYIAGGFRPAIAKVGPKWAQVVFLEGSAMKVGRIPAKDFQADPLAGYTTTQLARAMSRRTNCLGIKIHFTKTARRILAEARTVQP